VNVPIVGVHSLRSLRDPAPTLHVRFRTYAGTLENDGAYQQRLMVTVQGFTRLTMQCPVYLGPAPFHVALGAPGEPLQLGDESYPLALTLPAVTAEHLRTTHSARPTWLILAGTLTLEDPL
jgi:hypothetical protein